MIIFYISAKPTPQLRITHYELRIEIIVFGKIEERRTADYQQYQADYQKWQTPQEAVKFLVTVNYNQSKV